MTQDLAVERMAFFLIPPKTNKEPENPSIEEENHLPKIINDSSNSSNNHGGLEDHFPF